MRDQLPFVIDEDRTELVRDRRSHLRRFPGDGDAHDRGIRHGLHFDVREQLAGADAQLEVTRYFVGDRRLLNQFRVGFRRLNAVGGEQRIEDRQARSGIGLRGWGAAGVRTACDQLHLSGIRFRRQHGEDDDERDEAEQHRKKQLAASQQRFPGARQVDVAAARRFLIIIRRGGDGAVRGDRRRTVVAIDHVRHVK